MKKVRSSGIQQKLGTIYPTILKACTKPSQITRSMQNIAEEMRGKQQIQEITKKELNGAIAKLNRRKAMGPDEIQGMVRRNYESVV